MKPDLAAVKIKELNTMTNPVSLTSAKTLSGVSCLALGVWLAAPAEAQRVVPNGVLIQSMNGNAIMLGEGTITNSGRIISSGVHRAAIMAFGSVDVTNSGRIKSMNGNAITLDDGTITNSGSIISESSHIGHAAIEFSGLAALDSNVINEADGVIRGYHGIQNTGQHLRVTNSGRIIGSDHGHHAG